MRKNKKNDAALGEEKKERKRSERRVKQPDSGQESVTAKHSRKKKQYDGGISGDLIYIILMVIAILSAVSFVITVFFKVSSVEVTGTARTSASEIRAASGIEEGDRLLFVNRFDVSDRIFAQIPYADEIRVRKLPPNKVILEVTECEPAIAVSCGNVYYLIDDSCKLLEYFPVTGPSEYPVVTGLKVASKELGKTIDLGDELHIVSLQAVVKAFASNADLCKEVSEINMEKLYDVSFIYDGRLKVNLGEADELEKKLRLFGEVLDKLERTDKGTVGLKNTDSVTFLPD